MASQEDPNITYLELQTPHYKNQMKITKKEDTHTRYYFIVGDDKQPTLEGIITLENKSFNSRYNIRDVNRENDETADFCGVKGGC